MFGVDKVNKYYAIIVCKVSLEHIGIPWNEFKTSFMTRCILGSYCRT